MVVVGCLGTVVVGTVVVIGVVGNIGWLLVCLLVCLYVSVCIR